MILGLSGHTAFAPSPQGPGYTFVRSLTQEGVDALRAKTVPAVDLIRGLA